MFLRVVHSSLCNLPLYLCNYLIWSILVWITTCLCVCVSLIACPIVIISTCTVAEMAMQMQTPQNEWKTKAWQEDKTEVGPTTDVEKTALKWSMQSVDLGQIEHLWMWWRFTSRMCTWLICSSCVMSWQYSCLQKEGHVEKVQKPLP